jgi:hypothetical protein
VGRGVRSQPRAKELYPNPAMSTRDADWLMYYRGNVTSKQSLMQTVVILLLGQVLSCELELLVLTCASLEHSLTYGH